DAVEEGADAVLELGGLDLADPHAVELALEEGEELAPVARGPVVTAVLLPVALSGLERRDGEDPRVAEAAALDLALQVVLHLLPVAAVALVEHEDELHAVAVLLEEREQLVRHVLLGRHDDEGEVRRLEGLLEELLVLEDRRVEVGRVHDDLVEERVALVGDELRLGLEL